MKSDELLIFTALGIGAVILLTKGKAGNYVGESAGQAVGGAITGATQGLIKSVLLDPYDWAYNYKGYIPIIDDAAKFAVKFKSWGNKDRWLW